MTDLNKTEQESRSGLSDLTVGLAACPCGRPIDELQITDAGQGGKWANVSGNCCGEWMIAFHTNYEKLTSERCMALAIAAWNEAPRAANV